MNSLGRPISYTSLFKFALPTIISNVFMSIYTTIDGIFVSNLIGIKALSAVNIVMPYLIIVIAFGIMIGTGGSALVSKKLGEGKKEEARQNFTLLLLVCAIISSLIAIVGVIFREPILYMLGADESIFAFCEAYAIPLFITAPLAMLGIVFQMFFIAEGKPHLGMIFSVIGGVINIILDYLLIAKLGIGIQGAAIASGFGYGFPAIVGMFYFAIRRSGNLQLVKPKFDLAAIIRASSNGMSEMINSLSVSVVSIVMNNIVIRLAGADGIAAITVIIYAHTLLSSIYMGYATGIAPLISFNYGKKDSDSLKKIHKISLRTILILTIFTIGLSILLAKPIIKIFVSMESPVYMMAYEGFLLFAIAFIFMGYNIYSSAAFTALNNGKVSAILSLFRTLIFTLMALLIFPAILGITGVWIATPIAEALAIFMSMYYFRKMKSIYKYA